MYIKNVNIPLSFFNGIYNKISVLADREGNRDILYCPGKVAFAYATLLAYPEGLDSSECSILGVGVYDVSRAFQLGIVRATKDGRYQAIPCVDGEDTLKIEAKLLRADLKEMSRDAKEYYIWALGVLQSKKRQVEGRVFIGTIDDIFACTEGVDPMGNRTFKDVRIESLAKIDPLLEYGLIEMNKSGKQSLDLSDISEKNKEMKVAFRINDVGGVDLPEQKFEIAKVDRVKSVSDYF